MCGHYIGTQSGLRHRAEKETEHCTMWDSALINISKVGVGGQGEGGGEEEKYEWNFNSLLLKMAQRLMVDTYKNFISCYAYMHGAEGLVDNLWQRLQEWLCCGQEHVHQNNLQPDYSPSTKPSGLWKGKWDKKQNHLWMFHYPWIGLEWESNEE